MSEFIAACAVCGSRQAIYDRVLKVMEPCLHCQARGWRLHRQRLAGFRQFLRTGGLR